jgi:hypothetical protein
MRFAGVFLVTVWLAMRAWAGDTNEVVEGPALWFPVGEGMVYRIYWGVIPVGEATITTAWIRDNGRTLLEVSYRARSNKVLSTLYPVDDTIKTLVEPETFRPVSFTMDMREGRHRKQELTTFDYEGGVGRWQSLLKNKEKTFAIDAETRDLVTFMYFARRQGFTPGAEHKFRVMADEKVYDLAIKARKDLETIDLPNHGEVSCLRLDPEAQFNGIFMRTGKATVWVSNDSRRLTTKVSASVPVVGSVKAILVRVTGPGEDAWVRPAEKRED